MAAVPAAAAPAPVQQAAAPPAGPLGATLQRVEGLPPPDLSLPALEHVANRQTYRVRPEDELEEAVWYSAEEENTLVAPSKIRLRSIHSKQATVVTFVNKSPYRVRALWLDFTGNEVVYSVLEPNTTRRYHTYQTHPWICRELRSGTRMLLSGRPAVVGMGAEQTAEITAPPCLPWSLDTHCCFPEQYKSSVKGLLLAHKHLEPYTNTQDYATCDQGSAFTASPLKRLALTPPQSPAPSPAHGAAPCSPRSALQLQGSLASKARRLTISVPPSSPMAACTTPRTPRATAVSSDSPAGSSDAGAATSTTSISISSEAAHFKATVTVSSPARAVLKQTVNIEVFNSSAAGSFGSSAASATVNFGQLPMGFDPVSDAMQVDSQAASCSSRSHKHPSGKVSKPRHSLFNNLMHSLKDVFRPAHKQHNNGCDAGPSAMAVDVSAAAPAAAATTHIQLHLEQLLPGNTAVQRMDVEEPTVVGCTAWPPVGTHLGHLPNHLLATIAELAAPVIWQSMDQAPKGCPDLQPTLLACPPVSPEEEQQQEGNANEQQDDVPALV